MEQDVIAQILAAYGIAYERILAPQKGYRNTAYPVVLPGNLPEKMINLMVYKQEAGIVPRITNANQVGDFLAANGRPARKTYSPKILQIQSGPHVRYAATYNYLPGTTIAWEAYTMTHLKALGQAMAFMHKTLEGFDIKNLPSIADENITLHNRTQQYFAGAGVNRALQQKLSLTIKPYDFKRSLAAAKTLPGQQALHMDFVRGNILYEGQQVSGILDFEKAGYGHKLLDIARTLAFLLVDCKYKDERQVRKYFLQSGYIKHGGAAFSDFNIASRSLLEELINFFLLHDFYKFLCHNPYEALPGNEHFVRTQARLQKTGLLVKI